jgi:WD40 repeat protein
MPFPTGFPIEHVVALSPDGERIAAVSKKTLQVWKATDGKLLFRQDIHDLTECVNFSSDGKFIVTGGMNPGVADEESNGRIWNAENLQLLTVLPGAHNTSACATSARKSRRILISDGLNGLRVYELITLPDLAALLAN